MNQGLDILMVHGGMVMCGDTRKRERIKKIKLLVADVQRSEEDFVDKWPRARRYLIFWSMEHVPGHQYIGILVSW